MYSKKTAVAVFLSHNSDILQRFKGILCKKRQNNLLGLSFFSSLHL